MNIEEYKNYFLIDNKSGYKTREGHIKKNFPRLYDNVISYSLNNNVMTFNQKLYNYLYDIKKIPTCLTCKKEIKWRGVFSEGYKEYCNLQCGGKGVKRIEKIKNTVKTKYGVDHISQSDVIKSKIKDDNIKKYGKNHFFQTEEFKEMAKKTNNEKYGTDIPIQSDYIKNRIVENNIKKYGVSSPSKLDSVKKKLKETNLERYGVDSVMKSDLFKSKLLDNKLEKFIFEKNIKYEIINCEDNEYEVIGQCKQHDRYKIGKNLFYHRIKYGVENPCIICNPISKTSSIKENEIKDYIKNDLNITIIENDRELLLNKEVDILVPSHDLAIEFNGLYWHSELFVDKNYHLNKTELANSKGFQLIHIFEDEWVFKNEIVKSIINNKLGVNEVKIYGRKTIIKEVSSKDSKIFLNKNHIQGNVNASIRIGLYYNDELVSLMTFGKKRISLGSKSEDGEYEMYRFCNKLNTNVIGGASKIFKYFLNQHNPLKIVSYADRRYFDGILYKNLNFDFIASTKPNYWYFKKNDLTREYRFKFRKDVLVKNGFDKSKTEFDIMEERGYNKIYDCGNLKFEYTNPN